MKSASINEYPQNACGIFVNSLNINRLSPPPISHKSKIFQYISLWLCGRQCGVLCCLVVQCSGVVARRDLHKDYHKETHTKKTPHNPIHPYNLIPKIE